MQTSSRSCKASMVRALNTASLLRVDRSRVTAPTEAPAAAGAKVLGASPSTSKPKVCSASRAGSPHGCDRAACCGRDLRICAVDIAGLEVKWAVTGGGLLFGVVPPIA